MKESIMCNIHTGSGTVTYEDVRTAMNGEPFTMSLTDTDEIQAVIDAVNQGIDAHFEACFCPIAATATTRPSERPGSSSFVEPRNARSAPTPCRSFSVFYRFGRRSWPQPRLRHSHRPRFQRLRAVCGPRGVGVGIAVAQHAVPSLHRLSPIFGLRRLHAQTKRSSD